MTRNTTTKLVATALAVASLGIAGTAQASEGQGVAIGEPTPGKPVPAQPSGPGTPAGPVTPATPGTPDQMPKPTETDPEEVDYGSEAYFKSAEAKRRFERYCNMKDAEPSHSDKKFCEDYRKHHGGTSSGDHENTDNHENTHDYEQDHYEHDNYEDEEGSEPAAEQAEAPNKGALPFTGLEIWQLGLLGLVLAGGGFGARRLLAS